MGAKKGNLEPKPTEILEKLEPKRLLSYYRAEQQRFRRFRSIVECECCGTMHWEFKSMSESDALKQEQNTKLDMNLQLVIITELELMEK